METHSNRDASRAAETADAPPARIATVATLELRLEDGYRRIEGARLRGADVHAWEEFWLQLLREYEDVCDGLRLAAA